jgi:hypothetical protein
MAVEDNAIVEAGWFGATDSGGSREANCKRVAE